MRISITNLRNAYKAYVSACERAGFDTAGYRLIEGSQTYGRAYRSYRDGAGTPGADMNGYLGSTCREAYEALTIATNTLWAVAELKTGHRS